MKKINLLYIQPYASKVGGVDSVLLQLIEGIDKEKFNIYVVLPAYSPYVERYENLGAKVIIETLAVFGKPTSWNYYFKNFFNLLISMYRLRKIIKKYNINLIHSHKMEVMGANILGKMLGIPTVQTVHELPRRPLIAYKFVGFLNHLFNDKVIVLCDRSKTMLEWGRFKSNKVQKIYNGIKVVENNQSSLNLRRELNLDEDAKLVVAVARLSPMKGIDYLIQAASQVKQVNTNIKFIIVGDVAFDHEKEYKQKLIDLTKKNNLEDTVFFLGLRRDVPDILEQADVFVLPSVYDIFPTVILEAMSKSLPVIATDVGGVPEMVREDSGIIVEPMNVRQLAQSIVDIFKMDYKKMGANGKKILENEFTQEIYVRNTVKVYESLLKLKG
jgi:glycosyltransferase involved in cell wall biosynthesis